MDENNSNKEINVEVLNYRLEAIETEIKNLKSLLIDVPLLISKVEVMSKEFKEDLKQTEERLESKAAQRDTNLRTEIYSRLQLAERRITELENEVTRIKSNSKENNKDIAELKAAPDKKSAAKWNYIMDYAFKALVTIAVGYFLYKIGLSN